MVGVLLVVLFLILYFIFPHKFRDLPDKRWAMRAKLFNLKDKSEDIPCELKSFKETPVEWITICRKSPFVNRQKIDKEVYEAMKVVGLLCPGYSYPSTEDVNKLCDFYSL